MVVLLPDKALGLCSKGFEPGSRHLDFRDWASLVPSPIAHF